MKNLSVVVMAMGPILAFINFHALIHVGLFVLSAVLMIAGMVLFMIASDD